MEVRPEIEKIFLPEVSLAFSIGREYGFRGFEVVREVSWGGIRPRDAVWMDEGLA